MNPQERSSLSQGEPPPSALPLSQPSTSQLDPTITVGQATPCGDGSATADEQDTAFIGAVDDYELIAEIARGGMGIVYKARHRTLRRLVALKTMRADGLAHAEQAERFDREMKATARLTHPNIVPIYDTGIHEGRPYYAMAYVSGGSLSQRRPFFQNDTRAAVALVEKVARALHYAHERGIVHRDMKPGNVLLEDNDEPRLSDFGLVKFLDAEFEMTQTGAVLGTPSYMAPEQAIGRTDQIGPATDIWALGVILYELVTGQRPFTGNNNEEVKYRIVHDETPPPRSHRKKLDHSLEFILLRCLRKAPAERYATAADLADDLRRWLNGETIVPRGMPPRARKLARRLAVAVAAAAILALAAYLLFREREADPPARKEAPPLVLIGERGPPDHVRWLGSDKETQIREATEGFTVATEGACFIEILAKCPYDEFRLEAEVKHDEALSPHTACGIYCAQAEHLLPQGKTHTMLRFGFADHGIQRGNTEPGITVLPEAKPSGYGGVGLRHKRFDPDPKEWRRLTLIVRRDEVDMLWDGVSLGSQPRAEVKSRMQWLFKGGPAGFQPDLEPRGGIGIMVHRAVVSFKNVKLYRLDQEKR